MAFSFNVSSSSGRSPLLLSGGLHFIILAIAGQADSPEVWPFALLAMSVVSFFAWLGNHRRYRQIHDLPTSKVASAAQGYVELLGIGRLIDNSAVHCPASLSPCCWYRYTIEEKEGEDKWKTVDEGRSVAHFFLTDDSGSCVISPDGAEVVTSEHKSWQKDNMRYNEWLLLPGDTLYAIGEFVTHTANAPSVAEEREDISALLSEWKNDQPSLLERFDTDRNGRIDSREWEDVRQAAQQQAMADTETLARRDAIIRKPPHGRPYLISNYSAKELARRFQRWSWLHLGIFFAALVLATW